MIPRQRDTHCLWRLKHSIHHFFLLDTQSNCKRLQFSLEGQELLCRMGWQLATKRCKRSTHLDHGERASHDMEILHRDLARRFLKPGATCSCQAAQATRKAQFRQHVDLEYTAADLFVSEALKTSSWPRRDRRQTVVRFESLQLNGAQGETLRRRTGNNQAKSARASLELHATCCWKHLYASVHSVCWVQPVGRPVTPKNGLRRLW